MMAASKAVFTVGLLFGLFLVVSARQLAQDSTQPDQTSTEVVEKGEVSKLNPEYYRKNLGYGGFGGYGSGYGSSYGSGYGSSYGSGYGSSYGSGYGSGGYGGYGGYYPPENERRSSQVVNREYYYGPGGYGWYGPGGYGGYYPPATETTNENYRQGAAGGYGYGYRQGRGR